MLDRLKAGRGSRCGPKTRPSDERPKNTPKEVTTMVAMSNRARIAQSQAIKLG